jgi:hypothetical protein
MSGKDSIRERAPIEFKTAQRVLEEVEIEVC